MLYRPAAPVTAVWDSAVHATGPAVRLEYRPQMAPVTVPAEVNTVSRYVVCPARGTLARVRTP